MAFIKQVEKRWTISLRGLCQVSPKRPKDADAEGASDVDNAKTEGKVNDVAAPEENTAAPGKQMADKVNCCESATTLEMAVNHFCIHLPPLHIIKHRAGLSYFLFPTPAQFCMHKCKHFQNFLFLNFPLHYFRKTQSLVWKCPRMPHDGAKALIFILKAKISAVIMCFCVPLLLP